MSAREISDAGRASQKPPSAPRWLADRPAAAQLGQDGLSELARDILRAGELLPGAVAAGRGGQLDRGAQRVVGTCGHSHDTYYQTSRSE
jgi:hypothetical protein